MSRLLERWVTSPQLAAVALPHHDGGTGLSGRPLGRCHRGGSFVYDPFAAYRAGLVTNPNVLVAGAIGAGKSTVVKMLLRRGLDDGRAAVVLDPKGEYAALADRAHGTVVRIGDGDAWCNPFSGDPADGALLATVLEVARGRALADDERYCLESTLRGATALDRPVRAAWLALRRYVRARTPSPERSIALGLRRLVEGDLVGLFEGPAAPQPLGGELSVLDLSAAWHGEAAALVGLAAMAAARRSLLARRGQGYLVVDEAWAVLAEPRVAHWLRGSWKLARARGTSHVLVLHRWSDVFATGDQDSAARAQALSILRDCETVFLLRQDPAERAVLEAALAVTPLEVATALALGRGGALVRFGPHRSVVTLQPDEVDRTLVDTDGAMRDDR